MTPERYAERLDALSVYVAAREADEASPTADTAAAREAAYERYAVIRDQDGPVREAENELEAEL